MAVNGLVLSSKDGEIGIITVNNPPVNALSPGVPEGIIDAIEQFEKDETVKAIVLIGRGRTFIAGADIREFGKLSSENDRERSPGFGWILNRIEHSSKPVIAAIHGTALGGGLETAMACHYRVAVPAAQLGQPEVKLGLIPGAGGTQRLPRLAGVAQAVEMCSSGNPISARDALKHGIVDEIVRGDLLGSAMAFARSKVGAPPRRTRDQNDKLGSDTLNGPVFAAAREAASKRQRNLFAPLAAIDAVEAATKLAFDEGAGREHELFQKCLVSDESRALIHVFFGEREVAKIPGISPQTETLPVNAVAVVGAGTMGSGIAMSFANAGIPVLLKETDRATLERSLALIRKNYTNSIKRGRFTQQVLEERLSRIQPTLTYDGFGHVDMAIEAAFESMGLKKQIFVELDQVLKPAAILASNTAALDIDEIASATSRPEMVIGTRFFSPANVMRLVEIVRGRATSDKVIATCMALSKKLGKVGVLVGNCRGFVGNRMFEPYRREAQFLVEEGASPEAVDQAAYGFGMAMGPLAAGDLAGLDVSWRVRKEYREAGDADVVPPLVEDRLCEAGYYGQKAGRGWYSYDENRKALHSPETDQIIKQVRKELGRVPRAIAPREIVERLIYALVNEGARILEERIAMRAGDIDIIYINGYGFPAYRGGPMWYADTIGLKNVYQRVLELQKEHGRRWSPAPLLKQLAQEGKTFAECDQQASQAELAEVRN